MWRRFGVGVSIVIISATVLTPIVHLSGIFPQYFDLTSRIDGRLRAASSSLQRLSGIKTNKYWEFICTKSPQCEWIDGSNFPEFTLYPDGLVRDLDGVRILEAE